MIVGARQRGDLRSAPATAFITIYGAALRPIHALGWSRVRFASYCAYFLVLVGVVVIEGVPTGRASLATIVVVGLGLTSIGRGWRSTSRVFLDWLPFTIVLMLYDRTRAVVDTFGITLHEQDILDAERWCFGGTEPTVWLQQHLYNPTHIYWYDALCTLVYTSHFLATPVIAAVLWLRDRALWLRYISRVVLLSMAGLLTYCFFPEAPPWLAARDGLTAPVERLSARGWSWFHLGDVHETLLNAQRDGSNPVAAMPSLHTAFATLVAMVVIAEARSRWRWLAALYPVAMGFTLVYCGEHYVLDLVAGVLYAAGAYAVMTWFESWRARRLTPDPPRVSRVKVGAVVSGGATGAGGT